MAYKTMLDLLVHFLADSDFRSQALHREEDALKDFNLDPSLHADVLALDESKILKEALTELRAGNPADAVKVLRKALHEEGFDLERARDDTHGITAEMNPEERATALMEMNFYSQGGVHLHEVTPLTARVDDSTSIYLRGVGLTHNLKVTASLSGQTDIDCQVVDFNSGVDISQRVCLRVTFPASGTWTLLVESGHSGDRTATQDIIVS